MTIIHGRLRAAFVAATLGFGLCTAVGASPASAADLMHFNADGSVDEFSSHAEMRGWLEAQGMNVPDEVLPPDDEEEPEGEDEEDAGAAPGRAVARSARLSASVAVFYRHRGANRSPTLLRQGPAQLPDLRRLLYGPCPSIPACSPRPSWNNQISSLRTVGPNSYTLLFEDRNYGGAAALVDPNVVVSNLAPFGWEDITSSTYVFG